MAMKHLASDPERRAATAREIAERYDIPIELMAKVLTRLCGRVCSSRTKVLTAVTSSRSRAATSVAAVLEAIDGPLTMTACAHADHECDQFSKCIVRDPLHRIRDRIAAVLAECSILEIVADPNRWRRLSG